MSFYSRVQVWQLPQSAFDASLQEMATDGRLGREGVALWLGNRNDGAAQVTHVVLLRGPGVAKRHDLLQIGADLMNDVTDLAIELGVMLVGQIHSHGVLYGTDLSLTDRRYGVMVPDYLSVVAPDFALRPRTLIADCGVHIYELGRGYRRFSQREISERLDMTATQAVSVLTVGEG